MPNNKTVAVCAVGVAIAAALAQLVQARVQPSAATARPAEAGAVDPKWGIVEGVRIVPQADGSLLAPTADKAFHRVIKVVDIEKPGRYRLSVDTVYDGASNFMIEIGGQPNQNYGKVIADLKSGKIRFASEQIRGAGVEVLSAADRKYRWWVDFDFAGGKTTYNLALLSVSDNPIFRGIGQCGIVLGEPSLTAVAR
ncbi:MAG TPA: hypothetical protein VK777_06960 [Reyranella sp.]|nr:hypothetical protein [Reyranella sp.]